MGVLHMFQDLGQRIRTLRQKKGIGLNAFAETLGVSPGYLSNLETGKTKTIQLEHLENIQRELSLVPITSKEVEHPIEERLLQLIAPLIELSEKNPKAADYLLNSMESGIDYFK
jgi:transcriptional regulator with XRE-family HTH domain